MPLRAPSSAPLSDGSVSLCPPSPSRLCYSSHGAYSQSKLALVLFTYHLQEQLAAGGFPVTVNAVDPGMVDTALYDNLWSLARAVKRLVAKTLFRVRVLSRDGIVWVFSDTGAKPVLFKRYRC